jgi:hypothetical protein
MTDPVILVRLTEQLAARGVADPRSVAIERLVQYGILRPDGTTLTAYGMVRDRMSPAERAIDRQVARSGHDPDDYVYDPATNRATLAPDVRHSASRKR